VGIETLVQARYELPAFSTLRRAAQKARAQVNHGYYQQICTTDDAFPTNTSLTIKDGEPVLSRLKKKNEPVGFARIDQLLSQRIPECKMGFTLT
jgi:transcriptional regulator of nitric oxide reductase